MMETRYFYRIGTEEGTGLWYSKEGKFTGKIHRPEFSWLSASSLQMPFEQQLVGYLSVADSLEHLYQWFSKANIINLQDLGFTIEEYISNDYKFYDLYKHNIINQKTSKLNNRLLIK